MTQIGEKISYAGDAIDGDVATVKARFLTKQGTEIPASPTSAV